MKEPKYRDIRDFLEEKGYKLVQDVRVSEAGGIADRIFPNPMEMARIITKTGFHADSVINIRSVENQYYVRVFVRD